MTRQEIITEVAKHSDFFCDEWTEFRGQVESYATMFIDLAEQAQRQYDREWEENRSEIEAAIARAQKLIGPAREDVALARKRHDEAEAKLKTAAEKITARFNKRWSELSLAEQESITSTPKRRWIERKQSQAVKYYHDRAEKPWRTLCEAKEKYEEIRARTGTAYYSGAKRARRAELK